MLLLRSEQESGGRQSSRYSYLDHRWRFSNVRGGLAVTLFIDASAPANSENDNFEFQYSLNGGNFWVSFDTGLIVANGTSPGTVRTASFPAGTRGDIHVRVIDTNTTAGTRALDSISVDLLEIRTDIDPNDFPPAAPSAVAATVLSPSSVKITWTDNSTNELGFDIWRSSDGVNYTEVGSTAINAQSFTDTSAIPVSTYRYRVSAFTPSFEAFSADSNQVTTPDGLVLAALTGGKQKGVIYVNLAWSGGASLTSVDIYRSVNGGAFTKVTSTANDGVHKDSTTFKNGTLAYRVQSANGSIISNTQSITF